VLAQGLFWACLATVLNTVAGLLQSDATRYVTARRPLARQPRYLAGLLVDGVGWLCTVAALQHLPVVLVQAVLACAIVLTAFASRIRFGTVLRRRDRLAVAACTAGLVLVAASAGTETPARNSGWALVGLAAAAGLLATGVAALWDTGRGWPLATLAGLAFGGASLAVRAGHLGAAAVLPVVAAGVLVAVFWLAGLAAHARALQLTGVARLTAIVLVAETVAPGLAGVVVLGDPVRPGWMWPMVGGVAIAVGGMLVLTGSPALQAPPPTARRGLPHAHGARPHQ
jgi:drug/metabolite transporter (DMT)-like permease